MSGEKERLIGRKEILPYFFDKWGITTWPGVLYCVRTNHIPMLKTPGGKPFLILAQIQEYEKKVLRKILGSLMYVFLM